jgi:hypothetical protein
LVDAVLDGLLPDNPARIARPPKHAPDLDDLDDDLQVRQLRSRSWASGSAAPVTTDGRLAEPGTTEEIFRVTMRKTE